MSRIRKDEYTFVTNNRTDFAELYSHEELHVGLIIIVPNVKPERQRELFGAVLSHIGGRDLTNAVVEVDFKAAIPTCREYPFPSS